jgi:exopolysaccharide/PEP-CTERM locus tyrosine autokinase
MGKIQKALEKVQAERATLQRMETGKSQRLSDSVIVAQLVVDGHFEDKDYADGHAAKARKLEVNRDAMREAGLIAPETDEQLLVNQYRDIKRPLIAHAFGKRATKIDNGTIIMVTSSMAGEGKTFSSINLALSMAREKDHSVLLVDADVAKPQTSEIFGASEEPGLLDLLEDHKLRPESAILATDVPGLTILPAGRSRDSATELLASSRMSDVLKVLASIRPNGIVLLDSPPLMQTSEAKVLASLVGQIALIVRAEHTSQDAVLSALGLLDEDMPVNLILNQARIKSKSGYYSYGYGQHGSATATRTDQVVSPVNVDRDMWGAQE